MLAAGDIAAAAAAAAATGGRRRQRRRRYVYDDVRVCAFAWSCVPSQLRRDDDDDVDGRCGQNVRTIQLNI